MFRDPCPGLAALWIGTLLLAAAAPARGDEFRLIPGVALKEEFNDNILFSARDTRSSFISTLSPKLSLSERSERLDAKLETVLDLLLYARDWHLNSVEQNHAGQAHFRVTPLFGLGGEAGYSRTTRPDGFLETTGQVTSLSSAQQHYSLKGDGVLSEKLTGSLSYAYQQTDYSDPAVAADYRAHSANLGLAYDLAALAPGLKGTGSFGYSTNLFASASVDMYRATLGLSYALHELWSVQSEAGALLVHSAFARQPVLPAGGTPRAAPVSNFEVGWTASLALSYRGELDSAGLSFSHGIQSAYGQSGAVQRTALSAVLRRRLSYQLSAALSGGYYANSSRQDQFASQAIDENTYQAAPSLRYEFSRDLALEGKYEFALVKDHQSGTDSRRNLVFVRLSLQWPLFDQ